MSGGAGLNRGRAVDALLALEDDSPDELFETLPGATVPFWADVRVRLAHAISEQQTGSLETATDDWTRWKEAKRLIKAFAPSRWDARRRARQHDVCFYVGGGTLSAVGDAARNWLVEDFAEVTEDALIIQRRPIPTPFGVPTFSPTLSVEPTIARSRLWARGHQPSVTTIETIDRLLPFFARRLGAPAGAVSRLRTRVLRTDAHRPHELAELRKIVERVRPKVVVMDTASYTYNGETVGVFKDAGAWVAEPQHGWIGPSHPAYNYGKAFRDPRLLRALPNELLTFGPFWSQAVSFPALTSVIGKPHLEARAAAIGERRRRRVLVVSSRAEPEETDRFVVELRAALEADWEVMFRPHPAERTEVRSRYPLLTEDAGVLVDTHADVYDSLGEARVVVGVASTVLFEAVAFGCSVVARDSMFAATIIGDAFGPRVTTADEAASRIREAPEFDAAIDSTIWAPGARDSFAAWARDRVARNTDA